MLKASFNPHPNTSKKLPIYLMDDFMTLVNNQMLYIYIQI